MSHGPTVEQQPAGPAQSRLAQQKEIDMTRFKAMGLSVMVFGSIATMCAEAHAQNSGYAHFSQTTDTIRILGNTVFPGTDWTYEMRIRLDASMLDAGVFGRIISEQRDSLEDKGLGIEPGVLVKADTRGHLCGEVVQSVLESSMLGQWLHLAWVRSGSTAQFFVDGSLTQAWSGLPTCLSNSPDS